jgi:HAD superfamily hydrolase (TIGR01490 family)
MKTLALFDFDGTITTKDSLICFIRFAVGDIKFVAGMLYLSPMLAAYKLKIIANDKAKQYMLAYFFKGMHEEVFEQLAGEYSLNHIKRILRPKAMQRVAWHQAQGHTVVVVSASIENWLKPWCDVHNLELLATKLTVKEGLITGLFLTNNCYGIEKVHRVEKAYHLSHYDKVYAYGDSEGDKALLEIADNQHYKPFRE